MTTSTINEPRARGQRGPINKRHMGRTVVVAKHFHTIKRKRSEEIGPLVIEYTTEQEVYSWRVKCWDCGFQRDYPMDQEWSAKAHGVGHYCDK